MATVGVKTLEGLEERYAAIKEALPRQQEKYATWLASGAVDGPALASAAEKLGLSLDVAGGQISYAAGPSGARFGKGESPAPCFCSAPPLPISSSSGRALQIDGAGSSLSFDLMYVRHGKTTGNTEPRVYQGYVDEPSNALNEIGLQQAQDAADKVPPPPHTHTQRSPVHIL